MALKQQTIQKKKRKGEQCEKRNTKTKLENWKHRSCLLCEFNLKSQNEHWSLSWTLIHILCAILIDFNKFVNWIRISYYCCVLLKCNANLRQKLNSKLCLCFALPALKCFDFPHNRVRRYCSLSMHVPFPFSH